MEGVPTFDMSKFINSGSDSETCKAMADCIHRTGILIIRDPRVTEVDNSTFIDMMEKYFEQDSHTKREDARPDIFYQVGATPEFVEIPRCSQEPGCETRIAQMPEQHRPLLPKGPDCKERFFWRIGETPPTTQFPALNAPAVKPKHFPKWEDTMNLWGHKMMAAVYTASEMLGEGLGLKEGRKAFTSRMKYGPHLLAPTGTNLERFGTKGTVIAGFHYDLNLLTIHGKSRYPGLYVWLRGGEKVLVKVPDGCLLIQAGKQLEILTAGYTLPGEHEVVVSQETVDKINLVKQNNQTVAADTTSKGKVQSLWRISSTLFSHIESDVLLQPLEPFNTEENMKKYPPVLTGHQVEAELKMIKLAKSSTEN